MVTLEGILENIVAEVVVIVLSFILSKLIPNQLNKEKAEKLGTNTDFLVVTLFLTSFSVFNLILNLSFWNNPELTTFLTLSSIALGFLTAYVYNNQCPSCKKFIRAKKRIDAKILKKFKKPWKYQHKKIWLYSNGNEWKTKLIGKEKTRNENWVTKQEFYECNYCHFHWDSGLFDVNLDENTRPEPEYIKTDEKDPNSPY